MEKRFVVVAFVAVSPPLKLRSVEVELLGKRYENIAAQLPPCEKQPEASVMPFPKVEVAVVEPTFNVETERPPAKVDVAFVEVAKYAVAVGVEEATRRVPSKVMRP